MALRKTWSNNIQTPVPSSTNPEHIREILHDHGYLITMSPIVTRYEKDSASSGPASSSEKIHYTVWEHIDLIPGIWKKEITFRCAFQNTESGVVTWITAPLGLTSQSTYTVRPAEAGAFVLDESIESSCNVALKGFVENTMVQTRKEMHQKILRKVEERANPTSSLPPRLELSDV